MVKLTLKAARVNAGYTQKGAARLLKVSNTTLCNWEKGASYPNVQQVDNLCALYSVSYDNLIFLSNNPFKTDFNATERTSASDRA